MSERVPQWLLQEERYEPPKDDNAFLRKSATALEFVASQIRRVDERKRGRIGFSLQVRSALTLLLILLVSAARNFAFVEIVGAALLLLLASYEPKKLRRILVVPFQAFVFSALIMAPSLFWGQNHALVIVPAKTLVSTTALALLASSTNWNRFTCAFKSFGVPDAVLFIFDLTLKYTVILSETCLATLEAARLRSVGRDKHKQRTLGGIVGSTFLHAQKSAQEQFDGMTCRCFSGNYRRFSAPFRTIDYGGVALCVILVGLFLYLEYAH